MQSLTFQGLGQVARRIRREVEPLLPQISRSAVAAAPKMEFTSELRVQAASLIRALRAFSLVMRPIIPMLKNEAAGKYRLPTDTEALMEMASGMEAGIMLLHSIKSASGWNTGTLANDLGQIKMAAVSVIVKRTGYTASQVNLAITAAIRKAFEGNDPRLVGAVVSKNIPASLIPPKYDVGALEILQRAEGSVRVGISKALSALESVPIFLRPKLPPELAELAPRTPAVRQVRKPVRSSSTTSRFPFPIFGRSVP